MRFSVSAPPHQLLRKRHIGNDIVTIVFQEPGALPFTPKSIRSHFQHVFIIVQVHESCTDKTFYRSVKHALVTFASGDSKNLSPYLFFLALAYQGSCDPL